MNIKELTNELCSLYEGAGFLKYKMRKFEEYSLYLQNKSFLKSEYVITFNDLSGRLLALKPDVTLSILKNSKATTNRTEKVYYTESVYRLDKKSHEYKEINQAGLEVIGSITPIETAEVIILALKSLKASNMGYALDIAHTGLLSSLIEPFSVSLKEKITECFISKNAHDLKELLSGKENAQNILRLLEMRGDNREKLAVLKDIFAENEQLGELSQVYDILEDLGFSEKINIDFSIIESSVYYNGIVFKGFIETLPKIVLSGGRYDKLSEGFKEGLEALGFAVYLDDLFILSEEEEFDADLLVIGENPSAVIKVAEEYRNKGKKVATANRDNGFIRYRDILEVR